MLASGIVYSINRFTGNGSQTVWELNFAGGYIRAEHVKAYSTSPLGVNTTQVLAWIGPNTVSVTPAVPTGHALTVYRDTPKNEPVVDFVNGSIINEKNLNLLGDQAVFAAAEMIDRFGVVNANSEQANTASAAAVLTANNAQSAADGAVATAGSAATQAANAFNLATTTAGQFAGLLLSVNALVGADFSQFGRLNVVGAWTATQTFNSIAVPTRTAGDSTTAAASTAFVAEGLTLKADAAATITALELKADATALANTNINVSNEVTARTAADTAINAMIDFLFVLAAR
jgi:hypothetical protein